MAKARRRLWQDPAYRERALQTRRQVGFEKTMAACRSRAIPSAERFWLNVEIGEPDDCWRWTGYINEWGYGRLWLTECRRLVLAHVLSYFMVGGTLADNERLHHVCRNTWCVNPGHVVPMDKGEHSKLHHPQGPSRSRQIPDDEAIHGTESSASASTPGQRG